MWNACSNGLRSGEWLGHFFTFKNSWVTFAVCFGSASVCTMKHRPIDFAAFDWIWSDSISLYTSELFWLLLSSVTSSINTIYPVPLEVMHAHAITLLHYVSQMMLYDFDHELFKVFSVLFPSRHSGTVSFFSEYTKLLICPLLIYLLSLMDLFCFWSLTIVCFTCTESSFDCTTWVNSNCFQCKWHT